MNVQTEASRPAPTPFHKDIPESRPVIYFYDREGRMIDPESVVDLTDDLEVQRATDGLTVRTEMEPLGELTVATHGRGEEVSGSVKVVSEGAIGGVLRYSVPGIGVTGVGTGPATRDALFPARRKQGGIRTAAALRNLGGEAMDLTCRLMSGGAVLEETTITLEPNGQTSWFIEDEFTSDRHDGLRGDGALHGARGRVEVQMVHGLGGRGGRRQPHLHHAPGRAPRREGASAIAGVPFPPEGHDRHGGDRVPCTLCRCSLPGSRSNGRSSSAVRACISRQVARRSPCRSRITRHAARPFLWHV